MMTRVSEKIPGMSGIILAGGESRRMGCDKSLLPLAGGRFIERVYFALARLFEEMIIVTNSTGRYDLPCRMVPDTFPVKGPLVGIHSGLSHCRTDKAFVVACDMPFLNAEVIRRLCLQGEASDIVVPRGPEGREPLHAVYDRRCLPAIERAIFSGEKRIAAFFPQVQVRDVELETIAGSDAELLSFRNINTPQEYFSARGMRPVSSSAPNVRQPLNSL